MGIDLGTKINLLMMNRQITALDAQLAAPTLTEPQKKQITASMEAAYRDPSVSKSVLDNRAGIIRAERSQWSKSSFSQANKDVSAEQLKSAGRNLLHGNNPFAELPLGIGGVLEDLVSDFDINKTAAAEPVLLKMPNDLYAIESKRTDGTTQVLLWDEKNKLASELTLAAQPTSGWKPKG